MPKPKLYDECMRVLVPTWLREELEAEATKDGITMSALVRQVVVAELRKRREGSDGQPPDLHNVDPLAEKPPQEAS